MKALIDLKQLEASYRLLIDRHHILQTIFLTRNSRFLYFFLKSYILEYTHHKS